MFCPNGYVLIEKLEKAFRLEIEKVDPPTFEVGDRESFSEAIAHKEILEHETRIAVLTFLEEVESLSLCAPDGTVLLVSRQVLTRFKDIPSLIDMAEGARDDGMIVLNSDWIVSTPKARYVPSGKENYRQALSQSARDKIYHKMCKSNRETAIRNAFHCFNGWSLAFLDSDFPKRPELKQICGDQTVAQSAGGRPRKQEELKQAYASIYPDGHGTVDWKTVLRQVEKVAGLQSSISTLKRALE